MKKLICMLSALCMLLASLPMPAFAHGSPENAAAPPITLYSEYDMLVSARAKSPAQLAQMGLTEEEIARYSPGYIEGQLLLRAGLDDQELGRRYSYTAEEIALLRQYGGQPLEAGSRYGALLATLEGEIVPGYQSANLIGISFYWQWSRPPAFLGIDAVNISWAARDDDNRAILPTLAGTSGAVLMYFTRGGEYACMETADFSTDYFFSASADIALAHPENSALWCKKGAIVINLETTATPIHRLLASFAYGHTPPLGDMTEEYKDTVLIEA